MLRGCRRDRSVDLHRRRLVAVRPGADAGAIPVLRVRLEVRRRARPRGQHEPAHRNGRQPVLAPSRGRLAVRRPGAIRDPVPHDPRRGPGHRPGAVQHELRRDARGPRGTRWRGAHHPGRLPLPRPSASGGRKRRVRRFLRPPPGRQHRQCLVAALLAAPVAPAHRRGARGRRLRRPIPAFRARLRQPLDRRRARLSVPGRHPLPARRAAHHRARPQPPTQRLRPEPGPAIRRYPIGRAGSGLRQRQLDQLPGAVRGLGWHVGRQPTLGRCRARGPPRPGRLRRRRELPGRRRAHPPGPDDRRADGTSPRGRQVGQLGRAR